MFCQICGKQISEGATHCENCGNRDFAQEQNNYAHCQEIRNLLGDNSEYKWILGDFQSDAFSQMYSVQGEESVKEVPKKESKEINQSDTLISPSDTAENQELELIIVPDKPDRSWKKIVFYFSSFAVMTIFIAGSLGFGIAHLLHGKEMENFIAEEIETSESEVTTNLETGASTEDTSFETTVGTEKMTTETITQTTESTNTKVSSEGVTNPENIDKAEIARQLEEQLGEVEIEKQISNIDTDLDLDPAKAVGEMISFDYENTKDEVQKMQLDQSTIEMHYFFNRDTKGHQYTMSISEENERVTGITYMEPVPSEDNAYFMVVYFYEKETYAPYLVFDKNIYPAKYVTEEDETGESNEEEDESATTSEINTGNNGRLE